MVEATGYEPVTFVVSVNFYPFIVFIIFHNPLKSIVIIEFERNLILVIFLVILFISSFGMQVDKCFKVLKKL